MTCNVPANDTTIVSAMESIYVRMSFMAYLHLGFNVIGCCIHFVIPYQRVHVWMRRLGMRVRHQTTLREEPIQSRNE